MKQYRTLIMIGSLLLLALLLFVLLGTAWSNLWLLGMGAQEWSFFAGWAAVVLVILLAGGAWLKLYPGHRVIVVIVVALLLGAVLVFAFAQYVFRADLEYHVYTSDDGQHTLIVEVESFLLNSWGTFYQQTSSVTREKLGSFNLGDFYPNVEFEFTWSETGCTAVFCGQTMYLEWVE